MKSRKLYHLAIALLLVVPFLLAGFKLIEKRTSLVDLLPKEVFTVTYEFDMSNLPPQAFVKAFLPENTRRQTIRYISDEFGELNFKTTRSAAGTRGKWETTTQNEEIFNCQFEVEGKSIKYHLRSEASFESNFPKSISAYLKGTENIQADHPLIRARAQALKRGNINQTLRANFDFVGQIHTSHTGLLTNAVTALKRNRASCNGKSRLFVALCRAQGIPARVVGGIILENSRKRTSHLWTEVYFRGNWIPFDVLNGHFAFLPANFLELYKGDNFLITHTKGIGFDYQFLIQKKYQTTETLASSGRQLWSLLSVSNVPFDLLRGILLLPLAALVIAIFRNIIGLKTFGIFLPVLIGLSFSRVSFTAGVITFGTVILFVSLLHLILEKWGLLHIPKVVIMLTCVVLSLLGLSWLGVNSNWQALSASLFFPVVVLSITAERFAKTLVEEQFSEALKILGATFIIALLCIPLFQSDLLVGFFLTFPEFYAAILATMLLLGRWIGMRVLEYRRFAAFSK